MTRSVTRQDYAARAACGGRAPPMMMDSGAVKERNPPSRRTPPPSKAPGCCPRPAVAPRSRVSVRADKDPVRAHGSSLKAGSGEAAHHVSSDQKVSDKTTETCQHARVCKGRASRPAPLVPTMCVRTGVRLGVCSRTDSGSDLSDCPAEPQSRERRPVRAPESPSCATPTDARNQGHCSREGLPAGKHSPGRSTGQSRGPAGDLLREIEELRSENAYLKDEVEELRAEMEEVRDGYLAEEVQQVQELRRELDRANKECCILQYRLRRAERRSLQVTHTGRVDGELVRNLEQDLKIAKDVTVRLHNELKSSEERCSQVQDENEMLRQKVVEVEMAKEALQNDLQRARESHQRRRGSQELHREKKSTVQEDSAELRCQLQFVQEESSVMLRRIAGLAHEKDEMEQELQKYKFVYGDIDCTLPLGDCTGGGPHTTQEAELRLRLRLVEEEANVLGRKIGELEVENRDLRAENKDILCLYEQNCSRKVYTSPHGDSLESTANMRRHLCFMEEEATLLRSSIAETEGRNKQLATELSRISAGPPWQEQPMPSDRALEKDPVMVLQEELKVTHSYISELIAKMKKLQYENHMLTSGMQHCSSTSHPGLNIVGAESCSGNRGEASEDGGSLQPQPKREGPIGGESNSEDVLEKICRLAHAKIVLGEEGSAEIVSSLKQEAEHLGKALDRLISDTHCLVYEGQLLVTKGVAAQGRLPKDRESAEGQSEPFELNAINAHMRAFRTELLSFVKKLEHLSTGVLQECTGTIRSKSSIHLCEGPPTSHDSFDLPILEREIITNFHDTEWLHEQDEERKGLQQDLHVLRHSAQLFYMKLCCLLSRWQGDVGAHGDHEVLRAVRVLLAEFGLGLQTSTTEETPWETLNHITQPKGSKEMVESGGPCWAESATSLCAEVQLQAECMEMRCRGETANAPENWSSNQWGWRGYSKELQGALSTHSCKEHASQTRDRDCSSYSPSGRSGSRNQSSWNLRTSENLLLEALCLDPLRDNGPSSARPDSSQSPCPQEARSETKSRGHRSGLKKENSQSGNLLRVKSVCSMSDFQRLMDSSPFLSDTGAGQLGDDTPPLSPDDLKYIDEFETKSLVTPSTQDEGNSHMDFTADEPWFANMAAAAPSTQLTRNLSDDMKEMAVPAGGAVCCEPAVHRYKDQACQTDASGMSWGLWQVNSGLQMEATRNTARSPEKCFRARGGYTPVSSPCRSIRKTFRSPASQSRTERPFCTLVPQHKGVEHANNRTAAAQPPRGTSESAWARSTTTRDSPVHTANWDGLSSLFSVIGTPVATHSYPLSPGKTPQEGHGTQTAEKNAGEGPLSPQHLITERQGGKFQEGDSATPGHKHDDALSRVPYKKLQPESGREDSKTPSRPHKDGKPGGQGPSEEFCDSGCSHSRPESKSSAHCSPDPSRYQMLLDAEDRALEPRLPSYAT